MIRTALRQHVKEMPHLEKLIGVVKFNIGFVFCIADPSEVRKVIVDNKVGVKGFANHSGFSTCVALPPLLCRSRPPPVRAPWPPLP